MQNLNNCYDETLNENFTLALDFYNAQHTHKELIEHLKNSDNIQIKQIAALKLETITSQNDANVLISNLVKQDGKIREAVAFKFCEFSRDKKYKNFFLNPKNYPIFLDAINDINGNICRYVIYSITNFADDENFCKIFCPELVRMTNNLIATVENLNLQDGKYKTNKEVFKLYWCLEAVNIFYKKIKFQDLKSIILHSKGIKEYTIREKVAKILAHNFDDKELLQAKLELKRDINYYVRLF